MNAGNPTEVALANFKKGIGVLNGKIPEFVSQFNVFTDECFKDGALTTKEKHLIALGIAIHAQDEYCIIYHTKGCLDNGSSEEEILDVIPVTAALGGGPSVSQGVTLLLECLNELRPNS